MNDDPIPSDYLKQLAPEVAASFKEMRVHIGEGPLDYQTREYVIIGGFALMGYEIPFRIHAERMLECDVPIENMRHALLALLGASAPLYPVVRALKWLDEVAAEKAAKEKTS
ncbi:hypothetical protein PY365_28085 [Roseiarcaceae bacterium H3SJ34-1]|uniref:hypothetical protein n=1 Tax=Terripilifer ovatus TaxID=3032367 RepID=UPI003AB972EE|nr:hypothetical protein [Roseiarcaceae bacterium H3SJ34-1]